MSGLTDRMRKEMKAITANLSHARHGSSCTKHLRYVDGKPVWVEEPVVLQKKRSMFPYKSVAMCVDPEDVPQVTERLRKDGVFVEFDRSGCPIIESTKQHSDLAKALGMKTGRDGYGHTDEFGQFHNSGRRRADEVATGRAKVRKAIETLGAMPDGTPPNAVVDVLREYDIMPTAENTG